MTRVTNGLFVTGTDTGVGKTTVSCAVVAGLRAHGVDVGVMKPVETGVGPGGPLDAAALRTAAGGSAPDPIEDVCPQRFAMPAAPSVAAAAEGRCVDLAAIGSAFARVKSRHDCVVVEGAGGLLVPLTGAVTMGELAAALALPLLVVSRARLGTINHTRLTLEAARARGLAVAGVVISHGDRELSEADSRNLDALRFELGELWLGELPHLEPGEVPPAGAIDLPRLLRLLGRAG